jgi:hypothetical protein
VTAPSAFLGLLIASACGFLFHLLRGGGPARLGLFVGTAWIGFFAGHFVGEWWDWHVLRLGSLNLFASVLGAILGLLVASVLAGSDSARRALSSRSNEMDDEG